MDYISIAEAAEKMGYYPPPGAGTLCARPHSRVDEVRQGLGHSEGRRKTEGREKAKVR